MVPTNDEETSTPVEIIVEPEAAEESTSGFVAIEAKDNNDMLDRALIEHEQATSPTPTASHVNNVTEGETVQEKSNVSIHNTADEPAEFNNTVLKPTEEVVSESNQSELVESVQTEVETNPTTNTDEPTKDNPTNPSVEPIQVTASDNMDESSRKKPKKNQVSPEVTSPVIAKKTKKNQIVPFDMVTDGRPTSAQSMRYHTNTELFTTQRTTTNLRSGLTRVRQLVFRRIIFDDETFIQRFKTTGNARFT